MVFVGWDGVNVVSQAWPFELVPPPPAWKSRAGRKGSSPSFLIWSGKTLGSAAA